MTGGKLRNGFARGTRAETISPIEGRRTWLLFLSLARDHCRRALAGETVDRFESGEFLGFARRLFAPFPVQSPASALFVAAASRDLARAVVNAGADERAAFARLLLPILDYLDAAIVADTQRRVDFARRISGERED